MKSGTGEKKRIKRIKRFSYLLFSLLFVLLLMLVFNKSIQILIDHSSIESINNKIVNDYNPGNADSLKQFLDTFKFEESTAPISIGEIKFKKRQNWSLQKEFDNKLFEETATFPSRLSYLNPSDSAFFYIYRKEELKDSKIILWLPGLGVSDMAFGFIKHFFIEELKRGYAVVVYIPPFHLNRKANEKENGDGFISSNVQNTLNIQLEAVRELRTMLTYLQQQNPKEISAWGGSMGASFLLLASQYHKFTHLSLMIPVIDWEQIMLKNKTLQPLLTTYVNSGFDIKLLSKAFKIISPVNYKLKIPSGKTLIQVAEYDQLTPKHTIINFAKEYGIKEAISYQRSHATILISMQLYQDYGNFLDSL
ncbi:MAG: hypothetical protein P1P88_04010 [Bacteroidales bacterium]|nr:hypothetical protein [Bacteroidales bacterium]